MAEKSDSFEEHLMALEGAVKALESGEEPLERSLTIYEEAVKHLKACQSILGRAEERVKVLMEGEDGTLKESDFDLQEDA